MLLLLLACRLAAADPSLAWVPAPIPATANPRPDPHSDFVLVDRTAWLSAQRDGSGSRARAKTQHREDGVPEPMLARLLLLDGDRALLEMGAGDPHFHCFAAKPWDRTWRVALWVDRAALLPLTVVPVERSFPDGSGLALRPGALVRDQGLWADGMLLPLDLAPAEVGLSYRESDRFPAAEGTGFDFLGPATPLSLGVRPLTRPPLDRRGRPIREIQRLNVGPDGLARIGLDSPCGQVNLLSPGEPDAVPDPDATGGIVGGVVGGVVGGQDSIALKAGTALWWPEGGRAGTLTEDRWLSAAAFPIEADGRRCLDLALGAPEPGEADRPDRQLKLCVKPAP